MIYTLGPPNLMRKFAKTPEEIRQLAIDRCWGDMCKVPETWEVKVDMEALVVTIGDTEHPEYGTTRYKILAYERRA